MAVKITTTEKFKATVWWKDRDEDRSSTSLMYGSYEEASQVAIEMLLARTLISGAYNCYATVEKRIVPIVKEGSNNV